MKESEHIPLEIKRKIDPKDIVLPPGYQIEVFASGLTTPINIIFTDFGELLVADAGITYHKGNIYVAHRGFIIIIKPDGSKENVPKLGGHHNNRVEFGPDGKMYFGQGTATNSGVVGEDNAD